MPLVWLLLTEMHFEVAKDVLAHNVHMLIEKPITYDLKEADKLIHMARKRNLVLQVGLIERFNPAIKKLEPLLKNPVFLESHRMNLFTTRGLDVDVVLDLMIHDLDIILHLVQSNVKEVHAVGMPVITEKTDIANVRLIFRRWDRGKFDRQPCFRKNAAKNTRVSAGCLFFS